MAEAPLHGVRVVEVCGWAGAFAGRLLADGGADVVRVVPAEGDPLAAEPPFVRDTNVSIQDLWYNAGKRVVAVDLATAEGRGELGRLARGANILFEDWTPGEAQPIAAADLPRVRVS